MTMVWPRSSQEWRRSCSTSSPVRESRLPVGSSAKSTAGREASARATATRCCWPPRELGGLVREPVAEPHGVDELVDPAVVALAAGDGQRQHDVLVRGERGQQVEGLEDEADLVAPQLREGALLERGDLDAVHARPCRASGRSRPARMCMSVDLPEPDGPMIGRVGAALAGRCPRRPARARRRRPRRSGGSRRGPAPRAPGRLADGEQLRESRSSDARPADRPDRCVCDSSFTSSPSLATP